MVGFWVLGRSILNVLEGLSFPPVSSLRAHPFSLPLLFPLATVFTILGQHFEVGFEVREGGVCVCVVCISCLDVKRTETVVDRWGESNCRIDRAQLTGKTKTGELVLMPSFLFRWDHEHMERRFHLPLHISTAMLCRRGRET